MAVIWGAALALAAQSANADATRSASFRQNGIEFVVPYPEGMCAPVGSQIEVANLVAEADERSVTHATILSCEPTRADIDYVVIKTPRSAMLTTMDRQAFLGEMQAQMNLPSFTAFVESDQISTGIENAFGEMGISLNVSAGIRPLGRDDVCVYLGGIAHVEMQEPIPSYDSAVGSCLTSVEGRPVGIHFYGDVASDQGVAALMVRARAMAETIRRR